MPDGYIELHKILVMRVRADTKGKEGGCPSATFDSLESKLPTLKGRKFYGTFRDTVQGEEYFAYITQIKTNDIPKRCNWRRESDSSRSGRATQNSGFGENNS